MLKLKLKHFYFDRTILFNFGLRKYIMPALYGLLYLEATAQNSEDYLYSRYLRNVDVKINRINNIALGADFEFTNSFAVISKTFVAASGIHLRALPAIKGFFPLTKKLSFGFNVPYTVTSQYSSTPEGLPGLIKIEFRTQTGIGDINAGFKLWDVSNSSRGQTEFFSAVSIIIPTGRSVFQDTSETFLPRGGGFSAISVSGSFAKYLTKDVFVSFDLLSQARMKTKYVEDPTNINPSERYNYATAEPVISIGLSFGVPVMKETNFSSSINLNYTEIYIGNTYTRINDDLVQFNGALSLKRLGLKWAASEKLHSTFSIFAGAQYTTDFEENDSFLSFLIDAQIPLGFNKIGFKIY